MKEKIKVEIQKMLSSRGFWASAAIVMIFPVADFVQQLHNFIAYHYPQSIFIKWMAMPNNTYASRMFFILYPVLAALPYAWSLAEDLRSGYAAQLLVREKRKEYFWGKITASFLSGGAVISAALLVNILLLSMMQQTTIPRIYYLTSGIFAGDFCSVIFYTHPVLYAVIWFIISFLWGGAFSMLCCALGFFIRRRIVLVPSMLIVYILQAVISEVFPIYQNEARVGTEWINLVTAAPNTYHPGWAILLNLACIILVSGALVYFRGRKYEVL
ncbi:MAG: hypothetical protein LKE61_09835 [Erysipelotrichaceae bacterium]|uniref:ABC transporter permease n=1 Tax=Grylomicrobium aquisgranensis TaxID=2926318 RepID=A0AB35U047_9FIRM|nr:hypothetical protein [Lactimicrobium massiliense]MCH4021160.1 hypothetical protein [Erysipelotrichaceae bacterium]MCI1327094.1 hypothetical protein [Solobacterium sp.]MDX8418958.1 hypothetical protein [Stecheria sp. CLA-KB-P133]MCH4043842.1 hypothetical protein [Erysipelotrichaceae bacterium]MCH4121058.1 hypothetical protein [Erysipelotrichaceae bacterium]